MVELVDVKKLESAFRFCAVMRSWIPNFILVEMAGKFYFLSFLFEKLRQRILVNMLCLW